MKSKLSPLFRYCGIALVAVASVAFIPDSAAITLYWDGGTATDNNQSDNSTTTGLTWLGSGAGAGYWDNGASGQLATWTAGNSAVFGGSAATQTVTAGTLTIGDMIFGQGGSGTGTSGTNYTITGGAITLSTTSTVTTNTNSAINSLMSGAGALVKEGAGTLTLGANNTYDGGTTVNGGILMLNNAGPSGHIKGALTINGGGQVSATTGWALGYSGTYVTSIAITGGILNWSGPETSGGTATDSITMTGGTINGAGFEWYNNYGSSHSFTFSTLASGTAATVSANIRLRLNTGTGTLTFNVADGAATDDLLISGNIVNGSGQVGGNLIKTGAGTMKMTGTNNYTGNLTVNDGSLLLNAGSFSTGNAISVTTSTATFGGKGSAGAVSVTGGTIQGGFADVGNLSLTSLSFTGSSALNLMPVTGTTASVAVSGALTTSGTQTLNITSSNPLGVGSYRLVSWGSIAGSGTGAFVLGSTPVTPGTSRPRSYALDTAPSTYIGLNVTGDAPVWTGSNNGAWDTATANNWVLASDGITPTIYYSADAVQFNDTIGTRNITISGADVTPASVAFNNGSGNDYTLGGSNGIAGSSSLTKSGAGALTINNANSYGGGTALSGGTLALNHASAIGTGPLTITGGTLDNTSGAALTLATNNSQNWNGDFTFAGTHNLNLGAGTVALTSTCQVAVAAGSLTAGGVISGSGFGITKTGAGSLALSGGSYTGATTINGGTLSVGAAGLSSSSAVTISGGSTLNLTAAMTLANNVTIASGQAGTVKQTGAFNSVLTGNYSGVNGTLNLDVSGGINTGISPDSANGPALGSVVNVIGASGVNQVYCNPNSSASQTFFANAKVSVTSSGSGSTHFFLGNLDNGRNVRFGALDGGNALTLIDSDNRQTTVTINGVVDGNFAGILADGNGTSPMITLVKSGSATQTLSGANTYSGTTTVNAGILVAANTTGSATGTGAVTVKSAATLAGTGSIAGATTIENGGFVSPGITGIGTLTVASSTMSGTYQCDLGAATSDLLTVTGTLTVGGTTSITFSGSPTADNYTIASYGTLSGSLPAITPPAGYGLVVDSANKLIKLIKVAGYDSWMTAWVTAGFTGDTAVGADPDADGMKNLLEFVLNGNPGGSDSEILPEVELTTTDYVFTFSRRVDSADGTTQVFEYGSTLADWTPVNITGTPGAEVAIGAPIGTAPNQVQTITVTIPRGAEVDGKLFGRLNVTKP